MTESLSENFDNNFGVTPPPLASVASIQCDLCLVDFGYSPESEDVVLRAQAICPRCNYHQPVKKHPRGRDLAIFGGSIAAVYLTTIVAVLITR